MEGEEALGLAPEQPENPKERPNRRTQDQSHVLLTRELDSNLGSHSLGFYNDRSCALEIQQNQGQKGFQSDETLPTEIHLGGSGGASSSCPSPSRGSLDSTPFGSRTTFMAWCTLATVGYSQANERDTI